MFHWFWMTSCSIQQSLWTVTSMWMSLVMEIHRYWIMQAVLGALGGSLNIYSFCGVSCYLLPPERKPFGIIENYLCSKRGLMILFYNDLSVISNNSQIFHRKNSHFYPITFDCLQYNNCSTERSASDQVDHRATTPKPAASVTIESVQWACTVSACARWGSAWLDTDLSPFSRHKNFPSVLACHSVRSLITHNDRHCCHRRINQSTNLSECSVVYLLQVARGWLGWWFFI